MSYANCISSNLKKLIFISICGLSILIVFKTNSLRELDNYQEAINEFKLQRDILGLDEKSSKIFRRLYKVFAEIAQNQNLTYFLYGGSLIGAYRNKTILPWDDDLDLIMDHKSVPKVAKQLKRRKDDLRSTMHTENIFKIFSKTDYLFKGKYWNWPFIDIFLFHERNESLFSTVDSITYNKTDIFPLKTIEFFGLSHVPLPQNVAKVLSISYGDKVLTQCQTNYYNHRNESYWPKSYTIPCSALETTFGKFNYYLN